MLSKTMSPRSAIFEASAVMGCSLIGGESRELLLFACKVNKILRKFLQKGKFCTEKMCYSYGYFAKISLILHVSLNMKKNSMKA